MEFVARSTGLLPPAELIRKPPCDVDSIAVLPHRSENKHIATGTTVKVFAIALVFERCTIEHAASGNAVSISFQLLDDVVAIIGDPLGVPPHRPQPAGCIIMTMGAGP